MPFPMSRFDSDGVRVNRACIAETPFMRFSMKSVWIGDDRIQCDRFLFYHNTRGGNRRKFMV